MLLFSVTGGDGVIGLSSVVKLYWNNTEPGLNGIWNNTIQNLVSVVFGIIQYIYLSSVVLE